MCPVLLILDHILWVWSAQLMPLNVHICALYYMYTRHMDAFVRTLVSTPCVLRDATPGHGVLTQLVELWRVTPSLVSRWSWNPVHLRLSIMDTSWPLGVGVIITPSTLMQCDNVPVSYNTAADRRGIAIPRSRNTSMS
jgi:hypothetical protein